MEIELKIEDTTLYQNIRQTLYTDIGFEVFDADVAATVKGLIGGITLFLSNVKNTSKAVAILLRDEKGIFKLGARAKFNPNEDDDSNPGHYSYELSFYEEDILNPNEDEQITYEFTDTFVQQQVVQYFNTEFNRGIRSSYVLPRMCPIVVQCILDWLSDNAKDKETKLIIDGYAECTTVIEKGKKVYSITPSAQMKELIKEDTTTKG